MFPAGMAGVALLLLRASVSATLVDDATRHGFSVTSLETLVLVSLPALFLIAGFLTPYACLFTCLIQMLALFADAGGNVFHLLISILNSGILGVLGPGAYSVDGRVFGRRLLVVPPRR